jgi:hypothetical protein
MSSTSLAPTGTAHDASATNRDASGNSRPLSAIAGTTLLLGPAAFFAGMLTSPADGGNDKASYLASLARDPALTQASAVLLHYGNLLMGVGMLAVPLLVRGRRGRVAALVGSLLAALGLLANSGSLMTDWFHLEIGTRLPGAQGAALSDAVLAHPLLQLCFGLAPFIGLGLLVAFAGLARAGVVGWWSLPAILAGNAGLLFLPYSTPALPAVGVLPLLAVVAAAGVRVLTRSRIGAEQPAA